MDADERPWQGGRMNNGQGSRAGGVWIALGAVAGSIIGLYARQPSLGLLGGIAAGAAVATAMWLRDRA